MAKYAGKNTDQQIHVLNTFGMLEEVRYTTLSTTVPDMDLKTVTVK